MEEYLGLFHMSPKSKTVYGGGALIQILASNQPMLLKVEDAAVGGECSSLGNDQIKAG